MYPHTEARTYSRRSIAGGGLALQLHQAPLRNPRRGLNLRNAGAHAGHKRVHVWELRSGFSVIQPRRSDVLHPDESDSHHP
jgi:hypothetical protein